jgi:DNA-binding transcriptional MerR regulator
MHRYVKVSELVTQLHVDEAFLRALEDEDLINLKHSSEGDLVLSSEDAERVRVALLLTGELDVNLAGVEVVMHMRDAMRAMQQQFSDILDALVEEMRRQLQK